MACKKVVILLILIATLVTGCSNDPTEDRLTGSNFKFDTLVSLTLITDSGPELLQDVYGEMDRIESMISAHDENSVVYAFNEMTSDEPMEIPEEMATIIEKSIFYSEISEGYFDITVFPLVKLWGIGTDEAGLPSEDELIDVLTLIDYKQLTLTDNHLSKSNGAIEIDLGGIAKGYAADRLVDFLRERGVNNGFIDLGGNLYLMGTKEDGNPWVAGIQNPNDTRGDYIATVAVSDKSIVTSGPYERFFEEDGVRYHHILDPFTGYPVENNISGVSIISDKSIDGDALSTTIFALGVTKGIELLNSLEGIDGLIITKDQMIYTTDDFAYDLTITDSGYKLFQ